jgi:beta-N-acetylhexosaminidase
MPARNDLQAAVGQLLIMGFDGTEISGRLKTCIAALQPGGVILFARNLVEPRQTYGLLRDCQKLVRTPLFTCVDMEGGTVDRLKKVIAPAPAAADVFSTGSKTLFREHGRLIGEESRALGFNTNFAPVVDLALPASRSVLTSRAVSPDPQQATLYAGEFLRGLREARVLGCGKHFPGLGEASLDSHHHLPTIRKSWAKLWAEDLYPYRSLQRQLPFIIVAHAAFPEITGDGVAASLSPHWVKDVLRKQIGYRGIVVSDDLEMAGATAAGSVEAAAVGTVRAGSDIYLVCHDLDNVWGSYQAVLREAERDRAFAQQITRSAQRLVAFKRKMRATLRPPASPPSAATIRRLRNKLLSFSQEIMNSQTQRPAHQPLTAAAQ